MINEATVKEIYSWVRRDYPNLKLGEDLTPRNLRILREAADRVNGSKLDPNKVPLEHTARKVILLTS